MGYLGMQAGRYFARELLGDENDAAVQKGAKAAVGVVAPPVGKAYDVLDALTRKSK